MTDIDAATADLIDAQCYSPAEQDAHDRYVDQAMRDPQEAIDTLGIDEATLAEVLVQSLYARAGQREARPNADIGAEIGDWLYGIAQRYALRIVADEAAEMENAA